MLLFQILLNPGTNLFLVKPNPLYALPSLTAHPCSLIFLKKTLLFYGSVTGFGTGLFMVKKQENGNKTSTGYGFLFGLSLGSDFRFSSINQSLSVVDEVLTVQHCNLSVISMEHVTVGEIREDFSKL